jgi:hypothetical protein
LAAASAGGRLRAPCNVSRAAVASWLSVLIGSPRRPFLWLTDTAACWRCRFQDEALRRDQRSRWGDASSPTLFEASFNVKWDRAHGRRLLVPVAPYCGSNVRGRVKVPLAHVKSGRQHIRTWPSIRVRFYCVWFSQFWGRTEWSRPPCRRGPKPMIPNHPVCLQVFGRIGYYECRITGTMRRLGLRGAAQCVLNSYVANAQPTGSRQGRYRGLY